MALAQEDLLSSRNQLTRQEEQIQELVAARKLLQQEVARRQEKITQQEEVLEKLQQQQVSRPCAVRCCPPSCVLDTQPI